jgi:hypothetical protein
MLMEFGGLSNFVCIYKRLLVNTITILKVNLFLRYCSKRINEKVTQPSFVVFLFFFVISIGHLNLVFHSMHCSSAFYHQLDKASYLHLRQKICSINSLTAIF